MASIVAKNTPYTVPAITALTGDVTASGSGSVAATLKNTGPGATGPIGDATHVAATTIDAQGRVTALSSVAITFPAPGAGTVTPAMLENGTAANQILLTGATPFAFARSVGTLNLGAYNVTIPASGTAALLEAANIFTTTQKIVVAAENPQMQITNKSVLFSRNFADVPALCLTGIEGTGTLNGALRLSSQYGIKGYQLTTELFNMTPTSMEFISASIRFKNDLTGNSVDMISGVVRGGNSLGLQAIDTRFTVTIKQNDLSVGGTGDILRVQNQAAANVQVITVDGATSFTGRADVQTLAVTGFTTQTLSPFQVTRADAAAGVSRIAVFTGLGSGSANDGGSLVLQGKTSTTAAQDMAALYTLFSTATHASLQTKVALQNRTGAGALTDRISADGPAVTLTGSQHGTYTTTAVDLTLDATHHFVTVTAASKTITLPTAVGCAGREYMIKATADNVIVDAAGTETIDGELTQPLSAYDCIQIKSNNANWFIV